MTFLIKIYYKVASFFILDAFVQLKKKKVSGIVYSGLSSTKKKRKKVCKNKANMNTVYTHNTLGPVQIMTVISVFAV